MPVLGTDHGRRCLARFCVNNCLMDDGSLGLLFIIDIINSQWSLKPWIKARTASGDSLVYRVDRLVSFETQYPYLEVGVYLSLFERDDSCVVVLIPSMSWHTAQGRLGEYARFLLWSSWLLEFYTSSRDG